MTTEIFLGENDTDISTRSKPILEWVELLGRGDLYIYYIGNTLEVYDVIIKILKSM